MKEKDAVLEAAIEALKLGYQLGKGQRAAEIEKVPCPCSKSNEAPSAEVGQEEQSSVVVPHVTSDSATFGFDSIGRLHTITYQNGTVVTYNYDSSVGNRTSVVVTCGGSGC